MSSSSNNPQRSMIERDGSSAGGGGGAPRSRAYSTRQLQQQQQQQQQDPSSTSLMSSTPLELNQLDSSGRSNDVNQIGGERRRDVPVDSNSQTIMSTSQGTVLASSEPPSNPLTGISTNAPPLPSEENEVTTEEIPSSKSMGGSESTLLITLLMTTTGTRHPYRIDDKYLKKQNIHAPDGDPFEISIYTLKELILREWRDEWESRPSNPSSIRLIHFGRLLDDKAALKDCRFSPESPNVVHMTVRPQEVMDEEDAKNTKQGINRDRDGRERTAGCRCEIL